MNEDKKIEQKITSTLEWSFFSVIFGFLVFFALIGIVWLLYGLISPILVGLLLAFIFRPIINWTHDHWQWHPWLTTSLLLLLIILLIASLMIYMVPLLTTQISQFIDNLPKYIEKISNFAADQHISIDKDLRERMTQTAEKPEKLLPLIFQGTAKSFGMLSKVLGNVSYAIVYMLLLIVFFVTFSLHLPKINEWFKQFQPLSKRDQINDVLKKIYDAAGAFLRTRLLIAVILSIFFSAGWGFSGVPYWLFLGIATGILNIIPYASIIGWIIALLINALESATTGGVLQALLWPTVVYTIGQGIDGWVLTPYLQGGKLEIHPVIIIFAVLAGGAVAGLLGMLIAIPLVAAWKIFFTEMVKPKLTQWAENN